MIIAEPQRSASQASPNAAIERQRRRGPRQLDLGRPPEQHRNDARSDQERRDQESDRTRCRLDDRKPGDLFTFRQLGHHA